MQPIKTTVKWLSGLVMLTGLVALPVAAQDLSIEQVRLDADGDGRPDRAGQVVDFSGVAMSDVVEVLPAPMTRLYVDDGTAGIRLQLPDSDLLRSIRAGDRVSVRGLVAHYNGATVVEPESLQVTGSGEPLAPIEVSVGDAAGERYESRLVRVRGRLVNAQNVELVHRGSAIRVRARRALLADPEFSRKYTSARPAEVTGIADQFDPTEPFESGYRLELLSTQGLRLRTDPMPWIWGALAFVVLGSALAWARMENRRAKRMSALLERVRSSEETLKEREHVLRVVTEETTDVIWELDVAADTFKWLSGAEELFLENPSPAIREKEERYRNVHPDDRQRISDAVAAALAGDGDRLVDEYRIVRANGEIRTVSTRGQILRDQDGKPLRMIGSLLDITDRIEAEARQRRIDEGLERAQRLESLGVLAGGVAHDFNNILTAVLGNTEMLLERDSILGNDRKLLEVIRQAALQASGLTRQMLTYAGHSSGERRPVDLNQVVSEISEMLKRIISRQASSTVQLAKDLPAVRGDMAQLQQLVMNLITNAAESLPVGVGAIFVRTELRPVAGSEHGAILGGEQPDSGDYVVLEVRDDGEGMDLATQKRIFEPFFSTKGEGRGLGLSGCLGIVKAHKGLLLLETARNHGTCFRVFLPPAASIESKKKQTAPASTDQLDLQILVVDDETAVRSFVADALRRWGVSTETARDGAEAVAHFEAAADRFDLVVMDLAMPVMNGEEAFLRMRKIREDIPVLFISGYGSQDMVQRVSSATRVNFLAKPFRLQRLRESLETLAEFER